MVNQEEYQLIHNEVSGYLNQRGIVLSDQEKEQLEIADFGLGRIREIGLQLVVYINTERYCAKELILLPWQLCPQHLHPRVGSDPGKEETFRCRDGIVYLYVPGPRVESPKALVPTDYLQYLTVWNEIVLHPGEQYTIPPNTPHWFQAGDAGAIVSEFSSKSTDEFDIFFDSRITR